MNHDFLELYHSGVLGMKWGVRNDETKARYLREKRAYKGNPSSKNKARYKKAKKEYKLEKKKNKYAQSWEKAYKHRKLYTNQELDELITRFGKEKQLKDLSDYGNKDKQSINDKINKAIDTGTKVVDLYNKAQPKNTDYAISLRNLTPKKLDKMSQDELRYVFNKSEQMSKITNLNNSNNGGGGKKNKKNNNNNNNNNYENAKSIIDSVNESYSQAKSRRLFRRKKNKTLND